MDATAMRLAQALAITQGGACRATLGFETESLWDSGIPRALAAAAQRASPYHGKHVLSRCDKTAWAERGKRLKSC